jgi:hypothetical protein
MTEGSAASPIRPVAIGASSGWKYIILVRIIYIMLN